MDNIRELKLDLDRAKREESRASSEMALCEQQMESQKKRLESLLDHRDECVNGLKTAKESGLSIVQMREYQLLLQHINTTVKEQQEKVDICQVNHERSREVWEKCCERMLKLKELLAETGQVEQDRVEEPGDNSGPAIPGDDEDVLEGITGMRLHNTRK